jgi:ferredoxin-type protein NapH
MKWSNIKYLVLRRISQLTLMVLYFGANAYGWKMLSGNLSSSSLLATIPLSDPFAILQMLAAGATIGFNAIVGAVVIMLFYGVIGGRAFCSWVCPVNMITDLADWLRRKLYLDKIERKVWASRNIRYYMFGLALIVSAVSGLAAFEVISPITIMNRGLIFGFGAGAGLLVAIFLFDLFVLKNGWCGHICPLGGAYSMIGKYNLFRVKHNSDNCTLCMKCKEVCPETPVLNMIGKRSEFVSKIECTNCGRCVDVCDDDALDFNIRSFLK